MVCHRVLYLVLCSFIRSFVRNTPSTREPRSQAEWLCKEFTSVQGTEQKNTNYSTTAKLTEVVNVSTQVPISNVANPLPPLPSSPSFGSPKNTHTEYTYHQKIGNHVEMAPNLPSAPTAPTAQDLATNPNHFGAKCAAQCCMNSRARF